MLDREQAERIRRWEMDRPPEGRSRWHVVGALAFGGVMLAAGLLLFVSAHWDELSAVQRMALLLLRWWADCTHSERWPRSGSHAMGVTLHAVGTVALGGAIALAGQMFNMEEHWPAAVLLWATGDARGVAVIAGLAASCARGAADSVVCWWESGRKLRRTQGARGPSRHVSCS